MEKIEALISNNTYVICNYYDHQNADSFCTLLSTEFDISVLFQTLPHFQFPALLTLIIFLWCFVVLSDSSVFSFIGVNVKIKLLM